MWLSFVAVINFSVLLDSSATSQDNVTCYFGKSSKNDKVPVLLLTRKNWLKGLTVQTGHEWAEATEPTFCQKTFILMKGKNTTNGADFEEAIYVWGHTVPQHDDKDNDCPKEIEETHFHEIPDLQVFIYSKTCSCCGNSCNDNGMKQLCSGPPTFTDKLCYSTSPEEMRNTDGDITVNDVLVPTSGSQHCYKGSFYNATTTETSYYWGAISLAPGQQCGDIRKFVIVDHTIEAHTCCGNKCNGPAEATTVTLSTFEQDTEEMLTTEPLVKAANEATVENAITKHMMSGAGCRCSMIESLTATTFAKVLLVTDLWVQLS